MFDIVIIGAGVTGSFIARELARYDFKIALLDKSYDVCNGSSKANSAIVHGGYDPKPSTMMAKFNIEGNAMMEQVCKELSVPFKRNGALILAFEEEDIKTLHILLERGRENSVPDLKILSAQETIAIEPNINENIKGALFSGTTGIVSPYELTIALAENAVVNGRESPLLRYKSESEKATALSLTEAYKKIICRCEQITEGEILDAVSREPKATTRDGVKRRARAGMGTCQGNHCGPLVQAILLNQTSK